MTKNLLIPILLVPALLSGPPAASASTPSANVVVPPIAAAPVELVRMGDHAMTCPALAAEINSLTAVRETSAPPARRKSGLLHMLGTAATIVPGVALVRSAVLVSAASAAQAGLAKAKDSGTAAQQPDADMGLRMQRRERLTAIFEEKHC